jgi:hypothetical protein
MQHTYGIPALQAFENTQYPYLHHPWPFPKKRVGVALQMKTMFFKFVYKDAACIYQPVAIQISSLKIE